MERGLSVRCVVSCLALASATSCGHTEWQAEFAGPAQVHELDPDAPFLKVHGRDGELWVLESWSIQSEERVVRGVGVRYDHRRTATSQGEMTIPFDDVALYETNRPLSVTSTPSVVLGVVTGASLALTAMCAINPKACFGSCPTFYADAGEGEILQAEGFSSSVARSLEATDVDAIEAVPSDGVVTVRMRNEALETHMVRSVNLLAVPVEPGATALHAGDAFHPVRSVEPPVSCSTDGASCLPEVVARDRRELAPRTDPHDLGARQVIELQMESPGGRAGVVLTVRHSFVSTFLFYQLLAWMGGSAGEWMLAFDEGIPESTDGAWEVMREVQRLRVELLGPDGEAVVIGTLDEMGPIAADRHLFLLPDSLPAGPLTVRVDMARGHWRIDEVALAIVDPAVEPVRLAPVEARSTGTRERGALDLLLDGDRHLVTYPGDEHVLTYVPPEGTHAFFVESRGYYYEWMREQWLAEESPAELAAFFLDTEGALRRLAPAFKRIEDDMERVFWESRITRPLEAP